MTDILIIDDNAVIRDVLVFTLQNHYNISSANDGSEGIELAKTTQFDLIITDLKMPKMDGLEFVREMRKNKSYVLTPILIITANLPDNKQNIKDSGATGWILKPFEPNKLLETIKELLK